MGTGSGDAAFFEAVDGVPWVAAGVLGTVTRTSLALQIYAACHVTGRFVLRFWTVDT
ncbi:hypothetical protein [Asanoa siamensis]|uniref:Uncharacterized protein n=1 Tax=Asanoa siamensis TaxID=926357 RepID=A0ABQ4D3E4_9ACTN|nr:hypothetical protein [Asanoa siamensis]GIF78036.1 hypothetical protein Asi02nite_75540 [Asanoa siamensis]